MLQYSKHAQYCKNASNVSTVERIVKDDSQSVFINIMNLTRWNANRCYRLRTPHLIFEAFQNIFSRAS